MIKKLDIKKFGQFDNYQWATLVGKNQEFKKLNIIYGRNYSGKTTLSRIFRCIEKGELHSHYKDGDFQIALEDGQIINHKNIEDYSNEKKVRVYNTDFVRENLSWLHNADGTILPFTVLGDVNVELEKKIKEINEILGSVKDCKGLMHDLEELKKAKGLKEKELHDKDNELTSDLKEKAVDIKKNSVIFDASVYFITHLKNDIDTVKGEHILTEEKKEELRRLLKEERKKDTGRLPESKPRFAESYIAAKQLVEKKVKLSKPIIELLADNLLQEWVRQGMDRHRNKLDTCAFCGNPLPADLWEKLDAHFVEESETLRNEISKQIQELNSSKVALDGFLKLSSNDFYVDYQVRLQNLLNQWFDVVAEYKINIDFLVKELTGRLDDIFTERVMPEVDDNSEKLLSLLKEFNLLIEENNKRTKTLLADQQKARLALRYSEVALFIKTINYNKRIDDINKLREEAAEAGNNEAKKEREIDLLLQQKRFFETQAQDESRGAELVNQYLSHYFGHQELKLAAVDAETNIHFEIRRDNTDAKNLSEGECSLISFCYFIAKLEDELNTSGEELYIYIDDPISSLDSNHTFFIYSLIESVITKKENYKQLFISTHSLDFLKYIKRLTKPKKDTAFFLMQKRSKNCTTIVPAPDYLKTYITEFNYLFSEIYACKINDEKVIADLHHYSFANNLRKFLEAYLYFKFPTQKMTQDEKLQKFFDNDMIKVSLVNRVVNEFSHLSEQFDRGVVPIEVAELKKVACVVLEKVEEKDPDQFAALCQSIGVQHPILPEEISIV